MAAQIGARKGFAGELPQPPCALSREGVFARAGFLFRLRSAGLSPRLARGFVASRPKQERHMAHSVRGLLAAVECAKRSGEAAAANAAAQMRRDRCATLENIRG